MNDLSGQLERLSTGIAGLDTVLNGGFFRGGIYLIQGTPGTGKTTIANQICFHRVARGERALYVTLLAEYHARLVQYLRHMSFFDESKLPDQLSYISGFRVMRTEGVSALLGMIRREILARKVSMLIIDGLVAAQRSASNDQAFNEFVHELQGIALAADCTILLVASAGRNNNAPPDHTMVDGILELHDQAFGWATERTLNVTKIRGSSYLRGKHTYKITNDGIVVYPRIEALLAEPTVHDRVRDGRVTSGNARLDAMLEGGLPVSSPTMLVGPSGVGKTTFGLHFLTGSSQEEPGLMLGFYETPARLQAKAQQVCRPLVPLLSDGFVELLWQPPTSDSLDAYAERLLAAVRRRGVRRLFLDGLGAFNSAPAAEQRMPHFLPALTNELRAQGVTTLYSLEAGNVVGPATPIAFGDLSVLAENLVLLRYVESGVKLHRLISILKVRDGDFDPLLHEFVMTPNGPDISESTLSAESIMRGVSPRDADAVTSRQAPRVD